MKLYIINDTRCYKISEITHEATKEELEKFNQYIRGMTIAIYDNEEYLYDYDLPRFLEKYIER